MRTIRCLSPVFAALLALIVTMQLPLGAAPVAKKPATKAKPAATKAKPKSRPAAKPKPKPKPGANTPKANAVTPAIPVAASIPAGPQTWALLIGVSKYQPRAPRSISDLNYPATDASGIRDALTDAKSGGLPSSNVLLLTDAAATKSAIMDAVASDDAERGFLKRNVKKGDKVIVFLAGHGIAKGVGASAKSYFLCHDATGVTTRALDNSAVGLRDLTNKLGALPASQFSVFIDACREDPTPGRGLKGNQNSDVMTRDAQVVSKSGAAASSVTFFACAVGQRAFEDENLGHGVFTYFILDAIREAAVPNRDGTIDLGGLATYVRAKVGAWAKTASSSGDTDFDQTPDPVLSEIADDANSKEPGLALMRVGA